MARPDKDTEPQISRDAWAMLVEQLEFVTNETRRLSDTILVMETRRGMWATFTGVVLPIATSILTAFVMKLFNL